MIKRLLASVLLFTVLIHTSAYALGFTYSAHIENAGNKKYKAVGLTPEIYNNISGNMSDLAIYDKDNQPVPYFINSFMKSGTEIKKSYEMKLINSFVKDEYFYYDYAIKSPQNEDVTATSIDMQTDKDGFAKKVELYGGYDNLNWEKVQDDILYNVSGNKKLEITFAGVKKYTHYRFKIPNNLEKVSFSSVALKYSSTVQKKEYFISTVSPRFTTEEREGITVIKIQGLRNLKLSSITIQTDSIFKRRVTVDGRVSRMLYNLEFENIKYKDLVIPLNIYKVDGETAEIIIENKDDKPIKILGIEAKHLVDELVFDGSKSSEYTLRFGDSEIQIPRSYDISNYRDQVLNEGYDVLKIKEIKSEPSKGASTPQYDYKLIFNITISVVAVVMSIVVLMKLKK